MSKISLQHSASRLHEKKNNKLARIEGGPRLAGSSFFDGKVTLRAGPTFLHMNTPTIRAYAIALGSSQLGQKD